jgi:hypothetical protein
MSFETNTLRVITLLDPNEGDMYNDLVDEDAWIFIINNIYNITRHGEDYVTPTIDGEMIWRSVNSYGTDLEYAMERW